MPGEQQAEEANVLVANQVMEDMLACSKPVGDEIETFILQLSANPFAPAILAASVDNRDGSFYHQLPCGCFVFWEILKPKAPSSFVRLGEVKVRVTGARFDTKR